MAVIHAENKFVQNRLRVGESVMDKYGRTLKKTVWITALATITGEDPIVKEYDTYTDIILTDSQVQFLKEKLTKWDQSDPGEVRINVKPVLLPWVVKKYWPWAVGAVVGGFLLGKIT